jgi:hypothetical protein
MGCEGLRGVYSVQNTCVLLMLGYVVEEETQVDDGSGVLKSLHFCWTAWDRMVHWETDSLGTDGTLTLRTHEKDAYGTEYTTVAFSTWVWGTR